MCYIPGVHIAQVSLQFSVMYLCSDTQPPSFANASQPTSLLSQINSESKMTSKNTSFQNFQHFSKQVSFMYKTLSRFSHFHKWVRSNGVVEETSNANDGKNSGDKENPKQPKKRKSTTDTQEVSLF